MRQMKWLGLLAIGFATLGAAQAPAGKAVTQGDVPFVSGGIGVDSEQALKAREKEFNVKLVFTLVEGNYLADVGVTIKDAAGKTLVEQVSDGPFFLAKLPPGNYSVSAAYGGKTQMRKVSASAKGLHTEYFRWPSNPQTDFTLPPEKAQK
jgi:hypothetical protein